MELVQAYRQDPSQAQHLLAASSDRQRSLLGAMVRQDQLEIVTWMLPKIILDSGQQERVLSYALDHPASLEVLLTQWRSAKLDIRLREALFRAPLATIEILLRHGARLDDYEQARCLDLGRADILHFILERGMSLVLFNEHQLHLAGNSGARAVPVLQLLERHRRPTKSGAVVALRRVRQDWTRERPSRAVIIELFRLGADIGALTMAQIETLFGDVWSLKRLEPAVLHRMPWHLANGYAVARESVARELLTRLPAALVLYVLDRV